MKNKNIDILNGCSDELAELKAKLDETLNKVRAVYEEEEARWHSKSERWQEGDKGQHEMGCIDDVECAKEEIDAIGGYILKALSHFEAAELHLTEAQNEY